MRKILNIAFLIVILICFFIIVYDVYYNIITVKILQKQIHILEKEKEKLEQIIEEIQKDCIEANKVREELKRIREKTLEVNPKLNEQEVEDISIAIMANSIYHELSPDLIMAIIEIESGFYPKAISRAGAIGLMQLMPDTAKILGVNPYDIKDNIKGGTQYIKDMLTRFKTLSLALAAYNAGPGMVMRAGYKIPQNSETPHYVQKVSRSYSRNRQRFLLAKNFN